MPRKRSHQSRVERKAKKATKRDRRKQQRDRSHPLSFALASGLDEAQDLLRGGAVEEAGEVLEELARRYPRRREVLVLLLDTYQQLDDMWSYQSVCQQLISLEPDNVDLRVVLFGAALLNGQWATVFQSIQKVLEHWPDHAEANEMRRVYVTAEDILQAEIEKLGVPRDEGLELLLLHDEIGLALNLGDYTQVIQLAERLNSRWPTFAPALNNRSEAHFRSGSLERAIADSRRVLEFDAGNFHALGNLTRHLFLSGAFEEAWSVAEKLKEASSESDDLFVKQAEALGILGDWPGILQVFQRAQERQGRNLDGLLYHLAGVAAAELGQHADARKHWKRAIKLQSTAEWSQLNLDDSKLPPGQQSGPWAFPIDSWLPPAVLTQLASLLEQKAGMDSDGEVQRRVRKFLAQYPNVEKLVPVLLERGDPGAKQFAVLLVSMAKTPPLLSVMRDFAFGRRGTDKLRHEAGVRLVETNAIEPGLLQMWIEGELREVSLMSIEITEEPTYQFPKEVEEHAREAWQAIHDGDGAGAEAILNEVLNRFPDDLSLLNNKAVAIQLQGRTEEALSLIRKLHSEHPDYLFARVTLAVEATRQRDYDAANDLLYPLLSRRRFHLSEYTAMCQAYIGLLHARGEIEGARRWLEMWENAAPDDERVLDWQMRLEKRGLFNRFFQ